MHQPPAGTASAFGVAKTRGSRLIYIALLDGLGDPVSMSEEPEIETTLRMSTQKPFEQARPGLSFDLGGMQLRWNRECERWEQGDGRRLR